MAKKKLEFRPDAAGTGVWSKLYITPAQRSVLLKWGLYSLLCVAVLVVQTVILSRLTFFYSMVELTPCAIALICLMEGEERGGVFALAASVVYVLSGTAPGTYCIALLTIPAVLMALFRSNFLRRSFSAHWLCAAAAVMVYQLGVFSAGLFAGLTYFSRIGTFLLTGLISVLVMPVLYPALTLIGRIGGETWKE